jgi:hypothetical protein
MGGRFSFFAPESHFGFGPNETRMTPGDVFPRPGRSRLFSYFPPTGIMRKMARDDNRALMNPGIATGKMF